MQALLSHADRAHTGHPWYENPACIIVSAWTDGQQAGRKHLAEPGREKCGVAFPGSEEAYTPEMAWLSGITRDDICGPVEVIIKKKMHMVVSNILMFNSLYF